MIVKVLVSSTPDSSEKKNISLVADVAVASLLAAVGAIAGGLGLGNVPAVLSEAIPAPAQVGSLGAGATRNVLVEATALALAAAGLGHSDSHEDEHGGKDVGEKVLHGWRLLERCCFLVALLGVSCVVDGDEIIKVGREIVDFYTEYDHNLT